MRWIAPTAWLLPGRREECGHERPRCATSMACPVAGPVRSAASVSAGARRIRATSDRRSISVSPSTTGSCSASPAGTSTSHRRDSWCQRRGASPWRRRRGRSRSRRGSTPARRAGAARSITAPAQTIQARTAAIGEPERRAQRMAFLVAVRRRLHEQLAELARHGDEGGQRADDHRLDAVGRVAATDEGGDVRRPVPAERSRASPSTTRSPGSPWRRRRPPTRRWRRRWRRSRRRRCARSPPTITAGQPTAATAIHVTRSIHGSQTARSARAGGHRPGWRVGRRGRSHQDAASTRDGRVRRSGVVTGARAVPR